MTSTNPIDRLSKLSAQRTARTDRLRDATIALLHKLYERCEVGDKATVDGCTLAFGCIEGRNYYSKTWFLTTSTEDEGVDSVCDLYESSDGYYGGDFDLPRQGARRADLIAFAQRAERFVAALIARLERQNAKLASGSDAIAKASDSIG
jgi:hypothetical protein